MRGHITANRHAQQVVVCLKERGEQAFGVARQCGLGRLVKPRFRVNPGPVTDHDAVACLRCHQRVQRVPCGKAGAVDGLGVQAKVRQAHLHGLRRDAQPRVGKGEQDFVGGFAFKCRGHQVQIIAVAGQDHMADPVHALWSAVHHFGDLKDGFGAPLGLDFSGDVGVKPVPDV